MNGKYRILLLALIMVFILWETLQYYNASVTNKTSVLQQKLKLESKSPQKVKISVYYESLCTDSRNFILKHLIPVYTELSELIILDFIPYGKAKTVINKDGSIQFTCQHTKTECLGNKIHACAINQIQDQMKQLKMIACMFDDGLLPFEAAERCCRENKVDYNTLIECANSQKSSLLLKEYGKRTDMVEPSITFIPTIKIDDGAKNIPLSNLLKDFKKEMCNILSTKPQSCI